MPLDDLNDYFPDWKQREELAEAMIPIIGKLYRKHIIIYCYGRAMHNQTVTQLMKTHRFARQIALNEVSEFETYPIIEAISQINIGPAQIDIGKLAKEYMQENDKAPIDVKTFVSRVCQPIIGNTTPPIESPQDIVLYGFGRIGRLLARLLIEKTGAGNLIRLKAVVVRKGSENDLLKRASLLRRDSVHGSFNGTIRIDEKENCIIANGNVIPIIYAQDPASIDYTQYGIHNALLIDNTGKWRDKKGLSQHLKAKGIKKVVLTAPAKDDLPNIVAGVNCNQLTKNQDNNIIGAASCTTNAIVPILKIIHDKYNIQHAHIETVHSYTNDQNLIDNYHPKHRRGRSAHLNMVITETGASSAVTKLLPELKGKLTGNAIRVPTPNISLAILNIELPDPIDKESILEYLRDAALHSPLQRQIAFTSSPEVVSSDFIGSRHACILDATATIVSQNKVILYLWYDNEFGYASQVIRVIQKWIGLSYPRIPNENLL